MKHTCIGAALVILAGPLSQSPQQPAIKSGVELVRIDVQVTSRNGQPAEGLRADQFEVNIDGKVRPVVALDYVRYSTPGGPAPTPPAVPSSIAERVPSDEGRVLILAVDQSSLLAGSRQAPLEAIKRLAAMADPKDHIGLMGFPGPGVMFSPSRDRAALIEAAGKLDGQLQVPRNSRVVLSIADSVDWTTDADYRQRIIDRECGAYPQGSIQYQMCAKDVELAANEMGGTFQMQALRSVAGLKSVVETVRQFPGRKTLVVLSAGFAASDRMGGKPDVTFEADMIGRRAAEANAVLYSLHLDVAFLHAFSAASAGHELQTVFRNSQMLSRGLERFTASGGGSLITVHAGPEAAIKRLLAETSAYYLLGVEAQPEHRDGETHRITVKVKQGGAQVRARASVVIPKPPA